MKLFPAKCHERATLRKLWRQTGNSSLLPTKCWPLLHVIRACSWRWPDVVAGISARFSKFTFVLFCYRTNHLMPRPLGNSEFFSLESQWHWDSRKAKWHLAHYLFIPRASFSLILYHLCSPRSPLFMLSLEHQTWRFLAVVRQNTSKNCIEVRAARAARLFFLIHPIISVIYGVSIVVTVSYIPVLATCVFIWLNFFKVFGLTMWNDLCGTWPTEDTFLVHVLLSSSILLAASHSQTRENTLRLNLLI